MESPRVSLLAIGNELVHGKIIDTNSAAIAQAANAAGLCIRRVVLCGDSGPDILAELQTAISDSAVVITTGGLGPTSDDLTRETLADAAVVPLIQDEAALAKLIAWSEKRKRPLNENNKKQAFFPAGSERIVNPVGTADAFITTLHNSAGQPVPVISLPGVPREMKTLLAEAVLPWITARYPAPPQAPSLAFRCFGLSESYLGSVIDGLHLPQSVEVAYRPQFPEILISLTHRGEEPLVERTAALSDLRSKIGAAIGEEFIFTDSSADTMAEVVSDLLASRGITLAAGESCSGGLLAHRLVSLPGASSYFLGSAVTYSNDAKTVLLGVHEAQIQEYGAVSAEIAIEMARGARVRLGAEIAVSITGIAGPDGGSDAKPVGTFYLGLSTAAGDQAYHYLHVGERNAFRNYATTAALDLVRRKLLALPMTWQLR